MRRVFTPVAVLAFISLACSAGAVDNTSTAKHEEPADARLSQKVTYEAKHKPAKVILADLSTITGVTLNAGASTQDWQVRDRRMNIFVKDLPLLNLMNSMGRVMGFIWTKNDKVDPPTYRMYMDRKSLAAAEAAKSRADAEERKYLEDRHSSLLDYFQNLPEYTPAELEKLKEENPYLYLMHKRGTDRLVQALLNEVPGYGEALTSSSNNLNLPCSVLSESTLNSLFEGMKAKFEVQGVSWGSLGWPWPDELAGGRTPFPSAVNLESLKKAKLRLTSPAPGSFHWDRRWIFGGVTARIPGKDGDQQFFVEHLLDPDHPLSRFLAKSEIQALETNGSLTDVMTKMSGDQWESLLREDLREQEKLWGCEPPTEHPDEPWLHENVTLKRGKDEPDRLCNIFEALAEESGYNLVSDSFTAIMNFGTVKSTKQELVEALTAIQDNYGYNWDKRAKTLEFRDRDWFRRRHAQIPDEWIERWKENFKKNGTAVLEDIAQMAALSVEQYDENIATEPVFQIAPGFVWGIRNHRAILKVYNSLSRSQRKLLVTTGIEPASLTMQQWGLAVDAFQPVEAQWEAPRFWEDPGETIRLVGSDGRSDRNEPRFEISVLCNEDKVLFTRRIALAKYVEPPKKETKPDEAQKKPEPAQVKQDAARETVKRQL